MKRQVFSSILVLALVISGTISHAQNGKGPDKQLVIRAASASAVSVEIDGVNFGSHPVVFLGGLRLAGVHVNAAGTEITAINPGFPPGTYLLHVSRGNGTPDNGTFNLTIGAVGATGATGATGPAGANGAAGAPGAPGATGATGPQGFNGANGAPGATGVQGPTGPAGPLSSLTCAVNQTLKWNGAAWVCAGTLPANFSAVFPDALDNTATVEIEGVGIFNVVVTSGPGLEVQRIPGFDGLGRPLDSAGLNSEMPFVFEYAGPQAAQLQAVHSDFLANGASATRSMSLIQKDLAGIEVFRWNLFEFALTQIVPGGEGRLRYTFTSQLPPNNTVSIERDPSGPFPSNASRNIATDTLVEWEGQMFNVYPVVELDTVNRTITMTFDYTETSTAFAWIHEIATGTGGRKAGSIIQQDLAGMELFRMNYFEVFPISFQHISGFGQVEKGKFRLVIGYAVEEHG